MNHFLKTIPRVLFVASILKALIITPDWPSSVVVLGVCSVFLFCEYYSQMDKIKGFEAKLRVYDEKITHLEQKTANLQDSLSATKMSLGFKSHLAK